MSAYLRMIILAVAGLVLVGCSDGNPAPRDTVFPVDFTTFVKTEVQKQSVDLEPVNINEREFNFNDQNNPQAFDDLFQ
ncbi:MAG: hypothetical protein VX339_12260 [Pseudomonadota bacterium]|nr:hypothetical protein [Pseudomonadota bacterium]